MVRNMLPTVVVADPDMFYQDRIVFTLQESFHCIRTNSLRETYQAILNERPSVVILELNQPDGDGLNLIEHLHADPTLTSSRSPKGDGIPPLAERLSCFLEACLPSLPCRFGLTALHRPTPRAPRL